jgi:hypothetical protein
LACYFPEAALIEIEIEKGPAALAVGPSVSEDKSIPIRINDVTATPAR